MSGAFEWTLKYFAPEPVPFKQCFHIGVTQLPLNNLGEASNVLFGGIKKKTDAFKVPFSKKERLCSLRLSASFASEWAEVRKCVNSCCGLFPWESDLPLFQELYCEQPEWWPKANEPLGYKQRVGEVFLSPVSAVLAVIVIFFSSLNTTFRNLADHSFLHIQSSNSATAKTSSLAKVFSSPRKPMHQPNPRFSGFVLQVSTLGNVSGPAILQGYHSPAALNTLDALYVLEGLGWGIWTCFAILKTFRLESESFSSFWDGRRVAGI